VAALDAAPADHVIRLTADCPLIDPKLVEAVAARHVECDADYTSNVFPRTFPKGLDVEVVRGSVLRTACAEATDPAEREHVTPFVYRRPERFRLANVRNDEWLGSERWTVDTAEDLEFVRELVEQMGDGAFSWRDAYKVVGAQQLVGRGEVLLVPAALEHRTFVLACRSDSDAVRWSRSRRSVSAEEHAQWYETAIVDPAVRLRVAILDDEPIGTVRVDVVGGVGEVGIAVLPGRRGEGLAVRLLEALLADCRADPQVVSLVATIHPENQPSLRAFAGAGFARGSDRDGFRVLHRPVHQPI
jgi:RimJ/RimL family protein N-acetyltransferase